MNTVNTVNGVTKTINKGQVTLDNLGEHTFKSDRMQAQLRQVINTVTSYPSAKIGNSLNDSLFGASDFGFKAKDYESSENRVAWMDVPLGTTEEQMKKLLEDNKDKITLYRILSNAPILNDAQLYSLTPEAHKADKGRLMEDYAMQQIVRYPDDYDTEALQGKIILFNGLPQYRGIFVSTSNANDEDRRALLVDEKTSYYTNDEIDMEIEATLAAMPTIA